MLGYEREEIFFTLDKGEKMNTRKLLVSVLMLVSVLLSACAPAATPTAPAAPIDLSTAQSPTVSPLGEHVVAEWVINNPEGLAFGFDSVWVPSRRDPNVTTRIDPLSNEVIAVIQGTGQKAKSVAVTGDSVWVAGQSGDLAPIDPKSNTVGAKVPGVHPRIAYGFDSIWAVSHQGKPLDRVDPSTSTIIASIPLGGTVSDSGEENDVFVTASAVWVFSNGELIKIDPATNSIALRTTFDKVIEEAQTQTTVPAGKGTDFLWLGLGQGLVRMDPNSGVGLTFLPLGFDAWFTTIAVTDDVVWVGGYGGELVRVNVATNEIDTTYTISTGATHVGIGFGSLWVAYESGRLVQRLDIAP
jgi:hypothetical protein